MALRDQLNDALNATPADNTRRLATLREVLAAVDAREGANDSEIQAIITRIISEREPRAATFGTAGQSELAKAERDEIGFLRTFLRAPVSAPAPKAAKTVTTAPDTKTAPIVSRTQMIIAAVAVVVLLAGGLFYYFVMAPGSSDDMLLTAGNQPSVSVHKDDRTMGNPKAPITMLEYAAPACPHCAHFFETVFPQVKKEYIDTGKVFYIFRVYPINPADGAAEAIARCLPADNYFQFIDLLFRNQKVWDPEYGITDVRGGLIQMARIAGMGVDKVDQCISNKDEQDRINAVAQDGLTKYNIDGVPTFIINGAIVQAPDATYPQLKARFDSLLSKK